MARVLVQGKLAQAIDLIVFDGPPMDVAAKQSGLPHTQSGKHSAVHM
jgi:hypothetical protein